MRSDRITPMALAAAGLALLLVAGACTRRRAAPGFTARDSAGVDVLVSEHGTWPRGRAWRVDAEPLVDIGAGTNPRQQLFQVMDAARLADGRIVVANAGTNQVRIYGTDGRWIRSIGRAGNGPGEFRELLNIRLRGDSIVTYDGAGWRIQVFDTTGALLGAVRLSGDVGAYRLGGLTPHGELMVSRGELRGSRSVGVRWDSVPSLLFDSTGALVDSVGTVGGTDVFLVMSPQMMLGVPPFGGRSSADVHDGQLYEGDGLSWQVHVYRDDGRLLRILRWSHPGPPVTNADMDSLMSALLAPAPPAARAGFRRMYDALPRPARQPAYDELVVDPEGDVWLRDYRPRSLPDHRGWHVFGPGGRLLGAVRLPRDLRVTRVGRDWLLGVWRDSLGVQYVQELRLQKH